MGAAEAGLAVDPGDLARAVGRPAAVTRIEPIDPELRLHSVTGGVYRLAGDDFSLVVKVVRRGVDDDPRGLWVTGEDVAHRNYWKREWLAFDSGLLATLPGRLRAPRTLLTTEPADGECWVWMEDVTCRPAPQWSLDDYATVAHNAATTQGSYAAGAAVLPDHEWLARDWLRGWVEACTRFIDVLDDDDALADERLEALRPTRRRVLGLWQHHELLLAIVDAAPRTLVHCDFWPANLFNCADGTTVAVDWSQVGIGALTQDLDQITLDTVWMQVRPGESLEALERRVLPAYLEGLAEVGCDVTEVEMRRWYAAAAAVHYTWLAGATVERCRDPANVAHLEQRFARPFAGLVGDRARVIEHALRLGEWALESGA